MHCFQMVWVDQDESGLADIKDLETKLKVYRYLSLTAILLNLPVARKKN